MSPIRTNLRRILPFVAIFVAAFCLDTTQASAQFRMGFGHFGFTRPMWGGGRFMRGDMPGRGFARGARTGWNDGGRRYYPFYPPYPIYPVYPVYPRTPVGAYEPPNGWRPHHLVAQTIIPPARPRSHRVADHTPLAVAGSKTYAPHEIITAFETGVSTDAIDRLARHYHLARLDSRNFNLIGSDLYRWRIRDDRAVDDVVGALRHEQIVASVQPNYLYKLQEQSITPIVVQGDPAQYVLGKLQIAAAHRLATGRHVLIAVIDSDIDTSHPDLIGAVVKNFDAVHGSATPHEHGTAMAGAIAAHGKLLGIAPVGKSCTT